ncbi:MAG: DUF2752 domain-containing protein [Actinomycetia bacterium]|nr:DUF2752 domain-containing protein [Actinomycetes bacterium]
MTETLQESLPQGPMRQLRKPQPGQGILMFGILGGLGALVLLRDPHVPGAIGICPSLALFGVYCPGCGSLRAFHDLLTGDVLGSVGHNVIFLPVLLGLVLWAGWQLRGWLARVPLAHRSGNAFGLGTVRTRWALPMARIPHAAVVLAVLLTVFVVLRNWPGSWLAP